MTYVIFGAPTGVGRQIAECLAAAGQDLVLVSRDRRDSSAQAADLFYRYDVAARGVDLDFSASAHDFTELDRALDELAPLAGIIVTAGASFDADCVGGLAPQAESIMRINFLSVCSCIEHVLPRIREASGAVIVGIGSVAACRGRNRNVVYAASKRALLSYFESLRHAMVGSQVRVQFYQLGYVDTNLAFGQRLLLPVASPPSVGHRITERLGYSSGIFYYPRFWYVVCLLLRVLPWPVFRRLKQ